MNALVRKETAALPANAAQLVQPTNMADIVLRICMENLEDELFPYGR